MIARTFTIMMLGLVPIQIEVEVDGNQGVPNLIFIGLTSQATEEAKERITTALTNCGIRIRSKRTIVNLAPAEIPKSGSGFDLAIAVGLLKMYGEIELQTDDTVFLGELSLDGKVKKIRGALPLALAAREFGFKKVILPEANASEVEIISGIEIFPISHLQQFLEFAKVQEPLKKLRHQPFDQLIMTPTNFDVDFADIKGQEYAKRALVIAAAGGHHTLLVGFPGVGKSLLAKAFQSILPPLTESEAIEVTTIHSIFGTAFDTVIRQPPFRSPHHTTSTSGLIGGGTQLRPGEISLSHRGVLFLDEFLEFSKQTIESLRQPLEEGCIFLSRSQGSATFPAKFTLIAAANPCPCGYHLSTKKRCKCSPHAISVYLKKLSGPIYDRFDLHVNVKEIEIEKLTDNSRDPTFSSAAFREKVVAARRKQLVRYHNQDIRLNAELSSKNCQEYIQMSLPAKIFLKKSALKFELSGRSYFKLLKVSQTIADLDEKNKGQVEQQHIAEALQYR